MIELAPHTAIMAYLATMLTLLFSFWIYHQLSSRKKNPLSESGQLYLCEYCHTVYYDSTTKPVTYCSSCNSLNKNNEFQKK